MVNIAGGLEALSKPLVAELESPDLVLRVGRTPEYAVHELDGLGINADRRMLIMSGDLSVIPAGLMLDRVLANTIIAAGTNLRLHRGLMTSIQKMLEAAELEAA